MACASKPSRARQRAYVQGFAHAAEENEVRVPRNPRRAYDQDGSEILPATVSSTRALGMSSVMAFCEARGCGHAAVIPLPGWPRGDSYP